MSYSFSVRTATKAAAKEQVAEKMAEVVVNQPVHDADAKQVLHAANTFIDLLVDGNDKDVCVNVSGSLGWSKEGEFTSSNVSVSAYLVSRV